MGICISSESSAIHGSPEEAPTTKVLSGLCSAYTKQGSKGLNQLLLYKGYGTENAAFCGVFDGHGKNGHVVSKIVNSRLSSSLIRSQKKVHANIDTFRKGDKINHVISSKQEFSRMGKRLFLMLSE
ncbi:putative protein phosphatase 2C 72 [Glycine max]|nr:putative protein phosphatase 2C 72 [Glycine max]